MAVMPMDGPLADSTRRETLRALESRRIQGRLTSIAIVAIAAGLMGLGVVMTFSAGARVPADEQLHEGIAVWGRWTRQLVYVFGGLGVLGAAGAMLVTLVKSRKNS